MSQNSGFGSRSDIHPKVRENEPSQNSPSALGTAAFKIRALKPVFAVRMFDELQKIAVSVAEAPLAFFQVQRESRRAQLLNFVGRRLLAKLSEKSHIKKASPR